MKTMPSDSELERRLGRRPTDYDRLNSRDKFLLLAAFIVLPLVLLGIIVGVGF